MIKPIKKWLNRSNYGKADNNKNFRYFKFISFFIKNRLAYFK